MAHEIEFRSDRQTNSFAFVGERSAIWHKLGQQMQEGASTAQWMAASNQDYTVKKIPIVGHADGEAGYMECDTHAMLVREDSGKSLGIVSAGWESSQNIQAYEFAQPLIDAGFCVVNTAATLFDGRRCFVLLKTREGFQLPGGDENEGYIVVQISHEYGIADLVLPTATRVVCNNTLQVALGAADKKGKMDAGKFVHRAKTAFSVDKAQALIEAYRSGLGEYAEQAKFLTTKRATIEQTRAYINKVFKLEELKAGSAAEIVKRREHNTSMVRKLIQTVDSQPGAAMSPGTWWSNLNAVTFWEDHGRWVGKDEPVRFDGAGADRKRAALKIALEMAN